MKQGRVKITRMHNPVPSSRSTTEHSEGGIAQPDCSLENSEQRPSRPIEHSEGDVTQTDGSLEQSGTCAIPQQHIAFDEKAMIAELALLNNNIKVLTASKTQHGVELILSWFLYFREESIGRAYESRQVGTAFTTVLLAAVMTIVGSSLRLIRVALGIETVMEAYGTEQISIVTLTLVVHLFIGGGATYVRNSLVLHTRHILTLATMSAFTIAICVHICTREVFVASPCAPVEIWIIGTSMVFAAPALAMQACVPVWVQPFIGFIFLQPMLVSPHLDQAVKGFLAFTLAGIILCCHQTEKEKRLAFVHELELLSQSQKSAAEKSRIEHQLALSKAENMCLEEMIRATELLRNTNTKLTRTEIERAKLELSCVISGDLSPWELGGSEEVSARNMYTAFKVTPVQRSAKVKQAWSSENDTAAWAHTIGDQEGQAIPKMSCLAAVSLDGKTFTARGLVKSGLVQERRIKAGTHPFVALEGEPYIRCCCATLAILV